MDEEKARAYITKAQQDLRYTYEDMLPLDKRCFIDHIVSAIGQLSLALAEANSVS
jgi:hypothetical protein